MANYDSTNSKRHIMQPSLSSQDSNGQTLVAKIGAGLSNLGNTCFLNSVLQCLTYTPPLISYLESGQHKATCWATGFCSVCALQDHIKQALTSSRGLVSPAHLVKNLKNISKSFRPWRQEDAHEYMRYLIESLENCCSPRETSSASSSSQDANIIQKIFGGQLRSQVKCIVCSTCSNTYDPFLDLSLEIVRADSLTKALNRFTTTETLEGDNKYYCSNCQKKVHALKQFTIDKSPIILTIQFKRFSGTGSSGGKIDKKIDFGRTLSMKPYISNAQESDANYSLYGVLVHAGWSTYSGHYYCFVRTAGGLWHSLDDSRVQTPQNKVHASLFAKSFQAVPKTLPDASRFFRFELIKQNKKSKQKLQNKQPNLSGEQLETNSSSTLKSNWFSKGALDIENDIVRGNEDYEGDACQSSKQHSTSCNSSSHLCSKRSCQNASTSSTFRYSTSKVDRNTHV